jgi:uncharacterized protein (DUF433 family)
VQNELLKRITIGREVCHGKTAIRGRRYPVDSILEYLPAGDAIEDILSDFSDLEREDILAGLLYASTSIGYKEYNEQYLKGLREKASWLKNINPDDWLTVIRG